jgi:hypothetical protein
LLSIWGKASTDEIVLRAGMFGAVRSQFGVVRVGPPVSGAKASSGRAVVAGSIFPGMS